MPLAKFAPFRAADMNQAWLRNERFWPCPPVPTRRHDVFDYAPVMEELASDVWVPIWLADLLRSQCVCAEPLREGDILAPCPVHGWVTH